MDPNLVSASADRVPDDLLRDWLTGYSPDAITAVEAWAAEDPSRQRWLSALRAAYVETKGEAPSLETETPLRNVRTRIARHEGQRSSRPFIGVWDETLPPVNTFRARSWRTGLLGAGLLLGLIVGGVVFRVHSSQRGIASSQTYHAAPGQRASIRLADGSTMLLAPTTSVAITARSIDVTGEAYFAVAPHTTRPFVVRTANATVQVLGTRFSVRHYPSDTSSQVVVDEGRVALHARRSRESDAHTIMSSRMLAVVTDSGITVTSGIAIKDYTSWTQGTLVFKGVALRDVITELVRVYDTDIRIADTVLAKQTMQMNVSTERDSLQQILDLICETSDAHYTRSGHAYVLSSGRMATPSLQTTPVHRQFPQPEQQYGR